MSGKQSDHIDNANIKEAKEHFKNAHQSMHQGLEELLPKGFLERRRAARKEILLGFRKLLDAAIEKGDKKE